MAVTFAGRLAAWVCRVADMMTAGVFAFADRMRAAEGGGIQPSDPDPDSILIRVSDGYVSWDDGRTWRKL